MRFPYQRITMLLIAAFIMTAGKSKSQIKPVKRHVLALWNSSDVEGKDYFKSQTHLKIEAIFNHFGMVLTYVDVSNEIPKRLLDVNYINRFRAVFTWYTSYTIREKERYLSVLETVLQADAKLLMFGALGVRRHLKRWNQIFKTAGIVFTNQYYDNPILIKVNEVDANMVEFERSLFGEIDFYSGLKSTAKKNDVYLKIQNGDDGNTLSEPVIIGPWGGIASDPFVLFETPKTFVTQWRVNPFLFIQKALEIDFPVPDVSTLYGKRLAYSHIDGDGFANISSIDRRSTCAQTLKKEILQKFKFPTSVSVIEAEISAEYKGKESLEKQARDIFSLSTVEMASHTFTHPLLWRKDAGIKEAMVYDVNKPGAILAYKIPNYKIDYHRETVGSIDAINRRMAPKNKRAELLFWSGNTTPPMEALAALDSQGYANINGGDARFDRRYPSYSYLAPIGRRLGKYWQIYSSNANENMYTNLWKGPFSGFIELIETFKRTESPLRIRPINIYYHFYSVEKISSLKALDAIYTWVMTQDIFPVFTSLYIKVARGFIDTRIGRYVSKKTAFFMTDYGSVRTFRMDNEKRRPDMRRSRNVVGFRHYQDALYIYIGSGSKTRLVLEENNHSPAIFVSSASVFVNSLRHRKGEVVAKGESPKGGTIILKGFDRSIEQLKVNEKLTPVVNGKMVIIVNKRGLFKYVIDGLRVRGKK